MMDLRLLLLSDGQLFSVTRHKWDTSPDSHISRVGARQITRRARGHFEVHSIIESAKCGLICEATQLAMNNSCAEFLENYA